MIPASPLMALLAAVQAVFPSMTFDQMLWDVPESFLYQAETIYANRMGWDRITNKPGRASSGFIERWESITGKKYDTKI